MNCSEQNKSNNNKHVAANVCVCRRNWSNKPYSTRNKHDITNMQEPLLFAIISLLNTWTLIIFMCNSFFLNVSRLGVIENIHNWNTWIKGHQQQPKTKLKIKKKHDEPNQILLIVWMRQFFLIGFTLWIIICCFFEKKHLVGNVTTNIYINMIFCLDRKYVIIWGLWFVWHFQRVCM